MIELQIRAIQLKLENEKYNEARDLILTLPIDSSQDKFIRVARKEMLYGNFGMAQLALDEYLYQEYLAQTHQIIVEFDTNIEFISKYNKINDSETN